MFRGDSGLSSRHFMLAGAIGILILMNHGIDLAVSFHWVLPETITWFERSTNEMIQFLSSTILALTFWESVRGYSLCSAIQKRQRIVFASAFFTAVFTMTVIVHGILPEPIIPAVYPWLVAIFAFTTMCSTFAVLVIQYRERDLARAISSSEVCDKSVYHNSDHTEDNTLLTKIVST